MVECSVDDWEKGLLRGALFVLFLFHFAPLVQLFVQEQWYEKHISTKGEWPWTTDPNKFFMVGVIGLATPVFLVLGYLAPVCANVCGDWCIRDAKKYTTIITWCCGCSSSCIVLLFGITSLGHYPFIFSVGIVDLLLFLAYACREKAKADAAEKRLLAEALARRQKLQRAVGRVSSLSKLARSAGSARALKVGSASAGMRRVSPAEVGHAGGSSSLAAGAPGQERMAAVGGAAEGDPGIAGEHMIDLEHLARVGAEGGMRQLTEVGAMLSPAGPGATSTLYPSLSSPTSAAAGAAQATDRHSGFESLLAANNETFNATSPGQATTTSPGAVVIGSPLAGRGGDAG